MSWYYLLAIPIAFLGLYVYWRFFWFFRDPERSAPEGEANVVSPADGTVIYIKNVTRDSDLFSFKKGRKIDLSEYAKDTKVELPALLIGIFMHPTSVHVNRAPISGEIESIQHVSGSNLPMTLTWWRTNLGIKPYEKKADHIVTNERNIVTFKGLINSTVIQIADIYVNRIEAWVKRGDKLQRGQRFGMIKFGSQVDIIMPSSRVRPVVKVGQKVRAGETIIAEITK